MRSASDIVLKFVCPALGAIIANIMFSAPVLDARRAVVKAHLGDLNPTPWAFMTGNCIGWITYGYLTQDLFVFFANGPGFILSVWLNLIATKLTFENHRSKEIRKSFAAYLERESTHKLSITSGGAGDEESDEGEGENRFQTAIDFGKIVWNVTSQTSPAPTSHENLVVGIITVWLAFISIINLSHLTMNTNKFIIGLAVNLNLVFLYGAPLSTIWHVLASRNTASIHIPTMAANTANGVFWTSYGVAVNDPFIIVPNAIGALFGAIQFVLILILPRKVDQLDLKSDAQNARAVAATIAPKEVTEVSESDRAIVSTSRVETPAVADDIQSEH